MRVSTAPADFITTTEAAHRLGTTRQTIAALLRSGKLRGIRIGKKWRINREDFERLLAGPPVAEREEPRQTA
jgi:excisionase family DNA binding protein